MVILVKKLVLHKYNIFTILMDNNIFDFTTNDSYCNIDYENENFQYSHENNEFVTQYFPINNLNTNINLKQLNTSN